MVARKLDKFFQKTDEISVYSEEIDPFFQQNQKILEKIYGKIWSQLSIDFVQDEIEPLFPFLKENPKDVNNLLISNIELNHVMRINFKPGINIVKDSHGNIFTKLAFGLLSPHPTINKKNLNHDTNTKIDFLIADNPFTIKRNSQGTNINRKSCRNLSEAQEMIAINLHTYNISKSQITFGLNVFDNMTFINLKNKPRHFLEKERIFYFGTPETREKIFIHHLLKLTLKFYEARLKFNEEKISSLNDENKEIHITNKALKDEKYFIEDELGKLNLIEATFDEVDDLISNKIEEKTFYEKQLSLHDKKRGFSSQIGKSNLHPLLNRELKLQESIEDLKFDINDLIRDQKGIARSRDVLRKNGKDLGLDISEYRVCSCGYLVDDIKAEKLIREGKCPICGNTPPDLQEKKVKLKEINKKLKNLEIKGKDLRIKIEKLNVELTIAQTQHNKLKELIKKKTDETNQENPDEIQYSITEASQRIAYLTKEINDFERFYSKKPRLQRISSLIEEKEEKFQKNSLLLKKYSKKLQNLNDIHDAIEFTLKENLNICRNLFETQSIYLGRQLGKEMFALSTEFRIDESDIDSDLIMKLNYDDILRTLSFDSIAMRLSYFIALLKMSLQKYFSIPNLFILTGISISELERFNDILSQLEKEYEGQFQIIFLTTDERESQKIPKKWYRIPQGYGDPFQKKLIENFSVKEHKTDLI